MSVPYSWRNLSLIAVVIGFSQIAVADDTTYRLVYRFQPGQFSHYDVDDRAEMLMQSANNHSKSVQQTQMLKSFRVVTADENGGAILEPIVEIVRMASQAGDRATVIYDSEKDQAPPPEFEKITGTIGRPLARFHVAANGRLLKVTMLVTDLPKSFSDAAQKADPTLNFLVLLPEQPVKIGDKWTEKYDTPVMVGNNLTQPVKLIRGYELAKVENNIATIRVRTTLLTPIEDPEILRQLALQTSYGVIEFDMQIGRVLKKSLKIEDKVVGAFGPQTMLEAQGECTEKLIPPNLLPRVGNNAPNNAPQSLPK